MKRALREQGCSTWFPGYGLLFTFPKAGSRADAAAAPLFSAVAVMPFGLDRHGNVYRIPVVDAILVAEDPPATAESLRPAA